MQLQNKLAGVCEDMCKEVGAYPKCSGCPNFVQPDSTPGVMTWEELLEHMDNLAEWGRDTIKEWTKQASALQKAQVVHSKAVVMHVLAQEQESKACVAEDLKHRMQLQNKLAGVCEGMCKEVGAYPKCSGCPDFVAPDSTPGVMTWEELLEHMDNLAEWGRDTIKGWTKQAAALQKTQVVHSKAVVVHEAQLDSKACAAEDLKHRAQLQNKLAGVCEDMCKEVGAYPKCSGCPNFVQPDSTPGVMTWEELLEHMDNLAEWGR